MNIAVRQLTPTELAIRERHLKFRQSIAEKAEALRRSKLEIANKQMIAAFKAEAAALAPESFPAETDPPEAPQGMHWFGPSQAPAALTLQNYPRVSEIQEAICKHFGITKHVLMSWRKTPDVVVPRQIGYYLCTELTPISLKGIGRRFGRDHTSVLHGSRKIAKDILVKEDLAFHVARLIEEITGAQQ